MNVYLKVCGSLLAAALFFELISKLNKPKVVLKFVRLVDVPKLATEDKPKPAPVQTFLIYKKERDAAGVEKLTFVQEFNSTI